jgi:hypothetical protein
VVRVGSRAQLLHFELKRNSHRSVEVKKFIDGTIKVNGNTPEVSVAGLLGGISIIHVAIDANLRR